jgi:CRISPR system Cascade subunit CasE
MSPLWFTRATLRTGSADVRPLLETLLGNADDGRDTAHRMLWTLMPQSLQRAGKPAGEHGDKAAFLWCRAPDRDSRPAWYLLGPEPRGDAALFDVDSKPWRLELATGDRLGFELTVNATVDRMHEPVKGRAGRRRVDVVMDAIHAAERADPAADRALLRKTCGEQALRVWWEGQGERYGFVAEGTRMLDYRMVSLGRRRSRGARQPEIGVARLTGVVSVADADAFARKIAIGFGRAKAFGNGLLLLRRAV